MTRSRRRWRLRQMLLMSLDLLATHRVRTALSMSALVIGVATVTVMVAAAAGAERRIVERVRAMGTNLLIVSAAPAPRVAGRQRQAETVTTLRASDAQAIIDESSLARNAAPAVTRSMVVRSGGRNTTATVTGTTPAGLEIRGIIAASGRPFDEFEERELRRVALVGPAVVRTLFSGADPIGRELLLGNVPFDVVGVMQRRGTDVGGTDLDNAVLIPLGTAMRRVFNIPYVNALFVQARSSTDLEALELEVREILAGRNSPRSGVAAPFVIQNQAVLLRTERGATGALRRTVLATAALSLAIGGTGILAVMLMSVRERVREIGLRRAVGATRRDVRLQFLLESGVLAVLGGGAGLALGVLTAVLASVAGRWDLIISWRAGLDAVLISALVGVGAGLYPAARAARLDPIRAIRAE